MSSENLPKILVTTPVWGEAFINLFGTIVLPSFLSKHNFQYLGKDILFKIYSTEEDIQHLKKYPRTGL